MSSKKIIYEKRFAKRLAAEFGLKKNLPPRNLKPHTEK